MPCRGCVSGQLVGAEQLISFFQKLGLTTVQDILAHQNFYFRWEKKTRMVAFIYFLKVIFFAAYYDVAPRRCLLLAGRSLKQSDCVGCDIHVRGVGLTECHYSLRPIFFALGMSLWPP